MEHVILYELKKNFHGLYPESCTISLANLKAMAFSDEDKLFIRTKEDWMGKMNLTPILFASLIDIGVFKELEYGIKVLYGNIDLTKGQVFTILGLDSIAPVGQTIECIEEAIIKKFKIQRYKK